MTKVEELELAVKSLPPNSLKRFRDWFIEFDENAWDKQILRDQKNENSGIAKLARKALIAHRQGKSSPL